MSKYKKGKIVNCTVSGIESYGIFVSLDDYYSGLIHISEITNGFVKNTTDYAKVGETIKAKILDVDEDECHVKLTIKNVDYRIENPRIRKIKETEHGFEKLKEMLPKWVNDKI